MKTKFPFGQFNSPTHKIWKQDRLRRHRVPLSEAWRGCVGLAMLWRNVDADFECHGDQLFYKNDNLVWACMRDVPAGHFPSMFSMNRRAVLYSSLATASLRHGLPHIDFSAPTRFSWDLGFMPYGQAIRGKNGHTVAQLAAGDTLNSDDFPREFALLARLTADMTRFAAIEMDGNHRPVRAIWSRMVGKYFSTAMQIRAAQESFPTPYLGFTSSEAAQLYWLATNYSPTLPTAYRCPSCLSLVQMVRLRACPSSVSQANGRFLARP